MYHVNGGPQCDEYQCLLFPIKVDVCTQNKINGDKGNCP